MVAEVTAEIPIPPKVGLIEEMRVRPGSMIWFVGEWVLIALMGVGFLTVVFLLCLGGYALVTKAPG